MDTIVISPRRSQEIVLVVIALPIISFDGIMDWVIYYLSNDSCVYALFRHHVINGMQENLLVDAFRDARLTEPFVSVITTVLCRNVENVVDNTVDI